MIKMKAIQPIGSRNIHELLRTFEGIEGAVLLVKGGRSANAKSMLGLMSLAIQSGDEIEVLASNALRHEVVGALRDYFSLAKEDA